MLAELQLQPPVQKTRRKQPPQHAVAFEPEPETVCYRGQALAIVRNFFEMSTQLGRLPSILGREFFRAKVSHHAIPSFEDQALFAHDIRRSLSKLNEDEMNVLTLVGLYDLTLDEAAEILHWSAGYISQRFGEAMGRLTQIFLDTGILRRDHPDRRQQQMKGRQAGTPGLARKKPCGSVREVTSGQSQGMCSSR